MPFRLGGLRDVARGVDIDGGGIDQRARPAWRCAMTPSGTEIDSRTSLPGGSIVITIVGAQRRRRSAFAGDAPPALKLLDRGAIDVDAIDLVPGLDQVLRHRQRPYCQGR